MKSPMDLMTGVDIGILKVLSKVINFLDCLFIFQFFKKGIIQNWWTPRTSQKFRQNAQCLINQYENVVSKQVNLKLNGFNTQGENIADNGGLKEAYLGYTKWVQNNRVEQRLPGLTFTPNQLFWISYAQLGCSKYRDENLKHLILTGFHTPGPYRIIGPLTNSVDFAKDFNCPLGSKMNPSKKCKVW